MNRYEVVMTTGAVQILDADNWRVNANGHLFIQNRRSEVLYGSEDAVFEVVGIVHKDQWVSVMKVNSV